MCYSKLITFLGLEIGKMLRSCGRIRYFYVAICSKCLHGSGFYIHVPNLFSLPYFLYLIFISYILYLLLICYFIGLNILISDFFATKYKYG